MERVASSSMAMAGDGVEVDEARNSATSCSILYRLMISSPELNKKGAMTEL